MTSCFNDNPPVSKDNRWVIKYYDVRMANKILFDDDFVYPLMLYYNVYIGR